LGNILGYFGNQSYYIDFPGIRKSGHFTGFPGVRFEESGADTGVFLPKDPWILTMTKFVGQEAHTLKSPHSIE